jgi:phosphatidylinositol alpha 1,6-mannosyltransferase
MRIALITETFLPKIDGITVTVCRFLDFLAEQDCETLLLAPAGGPAKYARTPVIGMRGYPMPRYPELKIVPPLANAFSPLRQFKPDIIHLVSPASLGLSGLVAARVMRVPIVASYHTDIPGYADRWGVGFLRGMVWSYFRWIHNQAALNLTPSAFTMNELEGHGFERVKVWAHGVDTHQFSPRHYSNEMRERLSGGETDKPLLLYVGRLSVEKRIDWLENVMRDPDIRLAVVGDGPARRQLEKQFSGLPVVFTGYLHGQELSSAYASADVFAFPSANETFGNVVLEAMASGLPVIVPDSGGVTDFVRHMQTGLMFSQNNRHAFQACIEQLVNDRLLRQELSQAGRSWATEHDWDSTFNNLLHDYRLLSKRQRPQTSLKHQS